MMNIELTRNNFKISNIILIKYNVPKFVGKVVCIVNLQEINKAYKICKSQLGKLGLRSFSLFCIFLKRI